MQAGTSKKGKLRRGDDEDVPSSEEEGIDVMNSDGDSSEEESDDSEEEARIREGFITDEDEDAGDTDRKRRKKKKRKHRERDFEALSEDDLDLVEQNTGVRIERPEGRKQKKLKRAGAADDESEDERVPDVADLFDDLAARRDKDRAKGRASDDLDMRMRANRALDMEDEDDMADFIEDDSPDEDDREREDKHARKAREKDRRKQRREEGLVLSNLDITAEAWDEIQEVFGDGHDYDEALEPDDEEEGRPAPTMADVFEPTEIAERMLTSEDDFIRAIDIPERMQIAQNGISARPMPTNDDGTEAEAADVLLHTHEVAAAAVWCASRISDDLTKDFVQAADGSIPLLRDPFINAVQRVLHFLCIDYFEVPFIWVHRRDYFIHHDPNSTDPATRSRALLTREDLWKIYALAVRYRALIDKKAHLLKLWQKLAVEDESFTDAFNSVESLEEVSDLVEWVTMKYQSRLKELAEQAGANIVPNMEEAAAARAAVSGTKYKRALGASRYEIAKKSIVSRFAEQIAVPAETLAQDFITGVKQHFMDDPHAGPDQFAQEFTDISTGFPDIDSVVTAAKAILITEIAKEPSIRKEVRKTFKSFGAVSVRPTEKGAQMIDELHPYYSFKYLLDKPVDSFLRSPQFLQILAAEGEGLVVTDIHVQKEPLRKLTQEFYGVYLSDLTSADAVAWNKIREEVIMDALRLHLLPLGARWTRDWLKEVVEEWISSRCAARLEERIDVAPYQAKGRAKGEIPRVLAVSQGRGDNKRDWVHFIAFNSYGRLSHHERVQDATLTDKGQVTEIIKRIKPDVVVVGGFTPATLRLRQDIRAAIKELDTRAKAAIDANDELDPEDRADALKRNDTKMIYVHDDVARLFQNSKRALKEYGELVPVARYCIGLARYVQSPLCEFAALGKDLTAISFDPYQKLVPKAKLQVALESAMVNVVNLAGVAINQAIRDTYYRVLLPYVAGLGPRKAASIVERIQKTSDGTLVCRADLVKKEICTSRIFMNCVSFLRLPQEDAVEEEADYDVLDSTRIHSEDYHIARKMAADAEEMDEEDLEDLTHPSGAVTQLMENGAGKLDELSLDDFATALYQTQGTQKRLTLYMIRDELQNPYAERRADFHLPTDPEIFTMFTGETRQTLNLGLIIPVVIVRILSDGRLICRLDSGVEGIVKENFFETDVPYRVGQTVQAQVISLSMVFNTGVHDNESDSMSVDLSVLRSSISADDAERRKIQPDRFFDHLQSNMDQQAHEAKNKRSQGRQRRVVNHPNFHNYNAGQAEQYLANMQRGDCVVRPSSRGVDHLAVTWKVDDGVYQHIDVLELDKANEFSLGRSLRIGGKYTYSDLDELIVSHVRSMARKVDEMMHSDKYKGSESDLRKWLNTSIMAEPTRSFYGFALDARRPGNFVLSFLTKGYEVQSWTVTIEPEAFVLQGNADPAPNVTMLCNAFKSTYVTKMALAGGHAAGLAARTPYMAGGRTPMAGVASRTPNPYAPASGMTPYGQAARSPYVNSGQSPYVRSGQTGLPPPPPRPAAPTTGAYVHPSRMQQAGFGQR